MRHIPNILSAIRILMIPYFAYEMLSGNTTTAAAVLALSGFTDLLDGFLARRFNWISDIGKVLDPVADKLTQVTVCIVLLYVLRSFWVFFGIMLLKELVMIFLGGYLIKKGAKIDGARWFGKAATVCFYFFMTVIVLFPAMPEAIVVAMLGITTAFVVFAFARYIPLFFTLKSSTKNAEEYSSLRKD